MNSLGGEEKNILLWLGIGNNESAWAEYLSGAAKVLLLQRGLVRQHSIWEKNKRTFASPSIKLGRWRAFDDLFLNLPSALKYVWLTLRHAPPGPADLLVVEVGRGWAALLLRGLGRVRKVVSLQSDYLPPRGHLPLRMHRRLVLALNQFIVRHADEVWRVSPRIPLGLEHPRNFVIPLFIDDNQIPLGDRRRLVYIGNPTPDHALDYLFEIARKHGLPLDIFGESPYLDSLRAQAPAETRFHGYQTDREKIAAVLKDCFCGYAVYKNVSETSYSYYGIPSKSFHYLANNVPVLTTNTAHFSQTIEKEGIGRVVEPQFAEVEAAILELRAEPKKFYDAIVGFRDRWNAGARQFLDERLAALFSDSDRRRQP